MRLLELAKLSVLNNPPFHYPQTQTGEKLTQLISFLLETKVHLWLIMPPYIFQNDHVYFLL